MSQVNCENDFIMGAADVVCRVTTRGTCPFAEETKKTEAHCNFSFPIRLPSSSFSCYCSNDQFSQQTDSDDEEDGENVVEYVADTNGCWNSSLPDRWDVLGLGQAMVDFSGMVDDEFLERLGIEKGTRKLINHEERGRVLRAMDGCSYKAAAGGSLSNSLVALARLGGQPIGGPPLNVAMAGSVGSDPLGGFYRTKLRRANVNFLSEAVKDGTTGTVIVLTTPDAQRTMLAYQGTSSRIDYDPSLASIISKTNILVVEGYLFELPDTIKTITKACELARRSGVIVAVTASDVSCIERHYDNFWEIIENYADIVFTNSDEARALCHFSSEESPITSTRYLSHFIPLVSVTDGPRGSHIGVKGEVVCIPPYTPCVPVDTCGAGDAYASGILYGILRGLSDVKGMGTLAARVASVVVGQQGTRLRVQDALRLAESFSLQTGGTSVLTDVNSDQISNSL
ncbi:Carbohydrate/puine kinase, PfkB, conserved site protein [Heracleum sosnowskyi]|uniref:Carbohydrate/puine kinase, PfkB, conserved site protein n=1 Tax=Heracleum sosnowskyi TaxID=360622 RepID=A0AAD8J8Q0_9APIA|nr:Carbohydrate/puine kinase, PfkB, conserved site protein [Heracleum sosnowskyi]